MSLSNLKTSEDIANEKDSVGGGGVLESAVYMMKVTLAYLKKAASGAMALEVHLKTETGRDLRQTFWMTSGTEKGCKNYFVDKNGEKQYLPGFNLANSLALLTVGKEIGDLETEQKVVKLYSYEVKTEVPTKVDVFTDLIGQDIYAGVLKQTVDKTVKNDAGEYVPNGETRDENEVDKFFRAKDKMTTMEIRAQAEEASFIDTWTSKFEGTVKMKAKGTAGAAKPGATGGLKTSAPAAAKKPASSLFA